MTSHDDCDLLDELREGIAQSVEDIHAPPDIVTRARRVARRRTGIRAVAIGVPVLAAAGVAAATLGRSATTPHTPSSAHVAPPHVTAPPVAAHSTAYVVRRVRAKLAATNGGGVVFEITIRASPRYQSFMYVDGRTGVQYQRDSAFSKRGTKLFTNLSVATPVHDVLHFHNVSVNYQDHTWTAASSVASGPMPRHPAPLHHPTLSSSPRQIQTALRRGAVTQDGTATVNGIRTLILLLAGHSHSLLYVDARTYEPLRAVIGIQTWTWLAPTPANITRAKGLTIPPGYTRAPDPATSQP